SVPHRHPSFQHLFFDGFCPGTRLFISCQRHRRNAIRAMTTETTALKDANHFLIETDFRGNRLMSKGFEGKRQKAKGKRQKYVQAFALEFRKRGSFEFIALHHSLEFTRRECFQLAVGFIFLLVACVPVSEEVNAARILTFHFPTEGLSFPFVSFSFADKT